MTPEQLSEIRTRLETLEANEDGPWKFNPHHEMWIGETNMLETGCDSIDLGRTVKSYVYRENESCKGYVLTEESRRSAARNKARGEFLEHCREDLKAALERIAEQDARIAELEEIFLDRIFRPKNEQQTEETKT